MARAGLRVGVVGATGALGSQLIEVLGERHFPVVQLLPLATDDSLGSEVELFGEAIPVETGEVSVTGLDLLFLCAPPGASLEWARKALHAGVACIDVSGALSGQSEVPLLVADLEPSREELGRPVLAVPAGASLAWLMVLAPLARQAGLERVVGTSLHSVSSAGRAGAETLHAEVVALFNQREAPESSVFPHEVAFDCVPWVGEAEGDATDVEERLGRDLRRVLGPELAVQVTSVRVPTFAGLGASLLVETREPLSPETLSAALDKASGIEVWSGAVPGPTLRDATGRDAVLVGRVRHARGSERVLQLWLAADPQRLAAGQAVRLAQARSGG